MQKLNTKVFALLIAIFTLLFITSACNIFFQENEVKHLIQEEYYTFNPETILTSLATGKAEVFASRISTPEPTQSALGKPIQWQQVDYLHIAQKIHDYVWHESLEE